MIRLLLVFVTACCLSWGTVISFGSDLLNESSNISTSNTAINPHPAWASLPPYQWVSYAATGQPGSVSPSNTNLSSPTAVFYEYLPFGTNAINFTVFADDTAAVYLIDGANPGGLLLQAANPIQDAACAAGPVGCQPNEGWTSGWIPVDPSSAAILKFNVYQRGGGPFGLLYGGEANVVPEPATYALVAAGLFSLFALRRRRRNS